MEDTSGERSLPASIVNRVLKSALPDGVKFSKDVKKTMAQSGAIFMMFITTIAAEIAKEKQGKKKKPIISTEHIIEALEQMEFRSISQACEHPLKRK